MDDLPRLVARQSGSRLVTRREAADDLGYSAASLATLISRYPQRWPRPAAMLRVGRVWQMLWDLDELQSAVPPLRESRIGRGSTVSESDGIIRCLECGLRFRNLGRHLNAAHDMTAAEYRSAHQLPATAALMADAQRAQGHDRMMDADIAHLAKFRTPEHLNQMRAAAIESIRVTEDYAAVRAARAAGRRYAVQVMHGKRMLAIDDKARQAGYEGIDDAIRATQALAGTAAAAKIGIGHTTVLRRRAQLGIASPRRRARRSVESGNSSIPPTARPSQHQTNRD